MHSLTVLVDVGIETTSLLRFCPGTDTRHPVTLKGTFAMLHTPLRVHVPPFALLPSLPSVVLLTGPLDALGLPFLCEKGFSGPIFAVSPAIELFRQCLSVFRDFLRCHNVDDYPVSPDVWNTGFFDALPRDIAIQLVSLKLWAAWPSAASVDLALQRLVPCAYRQPVRLAHNVTAVPLASGFGLGQANWLLQGADERERIGIIGRSSVGTSRYPLPLDIVPLKGVDALIMCGAVSVPVPASPLANGSALANDAPLDKRLVHLCNMIEGVVRGGGCVLLPVTPAGLTFDIVEPLERHLRQAGLRAPIVMLSAVAQHSIAYSDISSEWMSQKRQARVLACKPPFAFEEMRQRGTLRVFDTLEKADRDLGGAILCHRSSGGSVDATSCVILAGDPSLRMGDAMQLVRLWRDEPRNAVIVVEPEPAQHFDVLFAPFTPMRLQALACPLDMRLNVADTKRLVEELRPQRLVAPQATVERLGVDCIPGPVTVMSHADVLGIPLEHFQHRAYIMPELSASLHPRVLDQATADALGVGMSKASFTEFHARAQDRDNVLHLVPAQGAEEVDQDGNVGVKPSVSSIVDTLVERGFGPVHVTNDPPSKRQRITVAILDATIDVTDKDTIITCNNRENRQQLIHAVQHRR